MTDPMCRAIFGSVLSGVFAAFLWSVACAVGDFVRWIRRIAC